MKSYKIAVLPGDGIGTEVTPPAVDVLRKAGELFGFTVDCQDLDWGVARWRKTGELVPGDMLEVLRPMDAILLGAMGWPSEVPDHLTLAPLVTIRQRFDQYACIRPAKLPQGIPSLLAGKGVGDIDIEVIRENSEGEYVDSGSRFKVGQPDEIALQTAIHTRRGIERIMRFSFERARARRKHLTMITKSNAQRYGYVLWDEILEELAGEFPDVTADKQHADAAVMNFVRRPETFDVVVASNLFGDILTDLGGTISGGLGMAPSTNTNPERTFPSMFEPVHGSAPDIAGQGIANPVGAIRSVAMMLDWLGEQSSASAIDDAVNRTFADGGKTPDLGGSLTTQQLGAMVVERLAG